MKFLSIGQDDAKEFERAVEQTPAFVKFYAPWCGHCKRMKADWRRLKGMRGFDCAIIEVHEEAIRHIQSECARVVRGFPTLMKVLPGGKIGMMYEGPRDYASLVRFIKGNFERTAAKRHAKKRTAKKRKAKKRSRRASRQRKLTQNRNPRA